MDRHTQIKYLDKLQIMINAKNRHREIKLKATLDCQRRILQRRNIKTTKMFSKHRYSLKKKVLFCVQVVSINNVVFSGEQ